MDFAPGRCSVARPTLSESKAFPLSYQEAEGYSHTLAEIWQQPALWRDTAARMTATRPQWEPFLRDAGAIVLTGSGSSYYVGRCLDTVLQARTALPVRAVEGGELLLSGAGVLPATRPLLVVSFARSGDSPESAGLIAQLLAREPEVRHLVITCNPAGRLARKWGEAGEEADARVRVLTLDERSCDRSLVMTSSFTSLVVAGLGLAVAPGNEHVYLDAVGRLAASGEAFLSGSLEALDNFPIEEVERLIAVGSGPLHGAALEVSLKMLEMTDGRVLTRAESCLGLRHGPMCALRHGSLLFMPLSSHPLRRAYQLDLLGEIERKQLRGRKVLVGTVIPPGVARPDDLLIAMPGLDKLSDEWLAIAAVVAGQLLSFLRCRAERLRPDEPSVADSITRVVGEFPLHELPSGVSG